MSSYWSDILTTENITTTRIPKDKSIPIIQSYLNLVILDNPDLDLYIVSKLNEENLLSNPIKLDVYGNVTEGPTLLTDLENYFLQPANYDSLLNGNIILCLVLFFICLFYLIFYFTNKLQRNEYQQQWGRLPSSQY